MRVLPARLLGGDMNRAERRRQGRRESVPTYQFTAESLRAQIDIEKDRVFAQRLESAKAEIMKDSRDLAFMLMLAFPLRVLMRDYWQKSARDRLPAFVDKVLEMYADYENGKISLDEIQSDLWEYGNVRMTYRKGKE